MAIDNDYTSSGYNSYFVDIPEYDSYVQKLAQTWDLSSYNSLDDAAKEQLMINATDEVNSFCFLGSISPSISSPFNMMFPRSGLSYSNGVSISSTSIPEFIKNYIAMRSIELLANQQTGVFYDGTVKRNKVGDLEQEFHNPKDSRILVNLRTNAKSYSLLTPYLAGISSSLFKYVQRA